MKLADLRKLAEARTKGEWSFRDDGYMWTTYEDGHQEPLSTASLLWEDADFVRAMANNIDKLLDVVDLAVKVNDDIRRAGFTVMNEKLYNALAALEDS